MVPVTVPNLRDAVDKSFATRLRSLLLWVRDPHNLVCVFEGYDHCYYGPRIDQQLAGSMRRLNIAMGGRKNVLKLYDLRGGGADQADRNALYFIDRDYDFDFPSNKPYLYVTPCYSVENLYLHATVFERIFSDVYGLPSATREGATVPGPAESTCLVNFATEAMQRFNESLGLKFNAFLMALRKKGLPNLSGSLQTFTNSSMYGFFEISHAGFRTTRDPDAANLALAYGLDRLTISDAELSEQAEGLTAAMAARGESLLIAGRGKFVFGFAVRLLQEFIDDAARTKPKLFLEKPKRLAKLDLNHALSCLSPFAETPPSLNRFLASHLP